MLEGLERIVGAVGDEDGFFIVVPSCKPREESFGK